MVRIEHHLWSKRSEGDVRNGSGLPCAQSASIGDPIRFVEGNGVCDPECFPWFNGDTPYTPTADRGSRTVRTPLKFTWLNTDAEEKLWLSRYGPIVAGLDIYDGFYSKYYGAYHVLKRKDTEKDPAIGGHYVLIVGYDDNLKCWIIRNSWGPAWGRNGYGRIGYGQFNIDYWSKVGLRGVAPDPWARRRLQSGNLIQSCTGATYREFQMLLTVNSGPKAFRALKHITRRDNQEMTWTAARTPGGIVMPQLEADTPFNGLPILWNSTYNRNYEAVIWKTNGYMHQWFFDSAQSKWINAGQFGDGKIAGYPGCFQGSFGAPGNFELAVRSSNGVLQHWWKGPAPDYRWGRGLDIASGVKMSGPAFVQGTAAGNNPGNFYVAAVLDTGELQMWWWDHAWAPLGKPWVAAEKFGSGFGATPPVMIQSQRFTTAENQQGNFELLIVKNGSVEHWWRSNERLMAETPGSVNRWNKGLTFGSNVKHVWGLMQSSYGGNLEAIVENNNGKFQHWWETGAKWYMGIESNF